MRMRLLLGFIVSLAACLLAIPASAHANLVRAEPGIGVSVPTAPTTIRLSFSERPEPRYSEIAVYSATHERFDRNDLRPAPDDAESLVVGVRDLPQGVYTVVWKTVSALDGHNTGGSFAFAVGNVRVSAATATQSTISFSNPKPVEVVAKWLAFLSASAFIGAFVLGMFIWTPALALLGRSDATTGIAEAVNRRLAWIVDVAVLVLIAASALGCLAQVGKATDRSLLGALRPGILSDFLFRTRTGSIWCLRLVLPLLAAVILGPLPTRLARAPKARETTMEAVGAFAAIALGANTLLAMSLLSHAAASGWAPLSVALDWLHLLATAIWIGGLVALAATIRAVSPGNETGRAALRAVVARFSDVALVCVGILALTGLYSAWLHVGSLGALWPTSYGRALLIKLALVAGLVTLGAFNLLWVRPRLRATSEAGDGAPATTRHFLRSVGAEVVLGALVLLVVGVLTGFAPAREAAAQSGDSPLAQHAKAGDLSVTLTPSTLQPGPITYDLYLSKGGPIRDAEKVALRFAAPDLGVDETEAVAASRGDGHYTVTGPYTALMGRWEVRAIIRRAGEDDVAASFALPIGSAPPATATTTPAVTPMVLILGIIAVIAVMTALAGAALIARRIAPRTPRRATGISTPVPIPDRGAD
jgi:copper transport protein